MYDGKKRIKFLDTIKGLAILGVIIIHVNAQFTSDILISKVEYDLYANNILILLSYFSRFCVPLFIMVTGYLYWDSKIEMTLKDLVIKLFPLILFYLIWSMVYSLPIFIQQDGNINFYSLFILGKSAPQMYYIPTIYIPVVIMIILTKKIYYSHISLGISIIFWTIFQLSGILNETSIQNLGFIFVYALIGAMFNYVDKIDKNKQRIISMCLAIPFLYFVYKFIKITQLKNFTELQNYYDYFQIHMLAYTLVIFGLFYFTKKSFILLSYIGKRSTVIYFQHWMFYIFIYYILQSYAVESGIFFYAFLSIIYFLCAYIPAIIDSIITKKNLG